MNIQPWGFSPKGCEPFMSRYEGKYLLFLPCQKELKHPKKCNQCVWLIELKHPNQHTREQGFIEWDRKGKRYIFDPEDDREVPRRYLQEISKFIRERNKEVSFWQT